MIRSAARYQSAAFFHLLAAACLPLLASCSSAGSADSDELDPTGAVGLELRVGDTVQLDVISYEMTGPEYRSSGQFSVANQQTLSAFIGGIPKGTGYKLILTAVDAIKRAIKCSGSTQFDVSAGNTTRTTVSLQCTLPGGTGGIEIIGTANVCPRIDSITASPGHANGFRTFALQSAVTDSDSYPQPVSYSWTATRGTVAPSTGSSAVLTCTESGPVTLTLTVSDGECTDTVTGSVECTAPEPPPAPVIKLTEIESSGGSPGDWVELFNAGSTATDLSGWVFKDNDDSHAYAIAAGTTLAPGAYLVLDEAAFGFGLGANDAARLFDAAGQLVDSYQWSAHAAGTYARCPDALGSFGAVATVTKGAANACSATPEVRPWPGAAGVSIADEPSSLGEDVSGLTFEPSAGEAPDVLWAVRNNPGELYRLVKDGEIWKADAAGGWANGKTLHYVDGTGNPDAEGVTKADVGSPDLFVATERNNDAGSTSRMSVLRFDSSQPGTSLSATQEWNLTASLPAAGSNAGLEAITFVSDSQLVAKSFYDEHRAAPYDPSQYPEHWGGLFLVGVEATGIIHAFVLDTLGGAQRVASIETGQPAVMALEFDRDTGHLWASCDDTCGNVATVLDIDATPASATFGRYRAQRYFARPTGLGNFAHEGIAIAPESTCAAGQKSVFWADDGASDAHVLRVGTIPCGRLF